MKRYDTNKVGQIETHAFGRFCGFEETRQLAKDVLPYLKHIDQDCGMFNEGGDTDCHCGLLDVRKRLEAIAGTP